MKDWLIFIFFLGRFTAQAEKRTSIIIVSPIIDFCSVIISCGVIQSLFSEIEKKSIINFENHLGEAFDIPKNTNDGEKIFSGILERADS